MKWILVVVWISNPTEPYLSSKMEASWEFGSAKECATAALGHVDGAAPSGLELKSVFCFSLPQFPALK